MLSLSKYERFCCPPFDKLRANGFKLNHYLAWLLVAVILPGMGGIEVTT